MKGRSTVRGSLADAVWSHCVLRGTALRIYQALGRNASWLFRHWPRLVKYPVFVVGCPRSGTSVFGRIVAQAPQFLYLHEPRYIWCAVVPELDVWAYRRPVKDGRLCWNQSDLDLRDAAHLAGWFDLELTFSHRRRLVEKTPLNLFRLRWLGVAFPEAKFIHIIRHGRDVALSLATAVDNWFPKGYWETSRHYGIFRDYALERPDLAQRLDLITERMDNYPRGLLVWLCSVTEGWEARENLGPDRYLEVRYESLVKHSGAQLHRIFDFLDEPLPRDVVQYAEGILHRDSCGKTDPSPHLTQAIAGGALAQLGYRV